MSRAGLSTDSFLSVVVGLALYNSAVLGEILRSGIRSLPPGQAMAGAAIG
jgi:glutamate transport system permease protein